MTPEERASIALYFNGIAPASDIVGPVAEREIQGKGRGLVATRGLVAGELVLAVRPLAVLHGPQDAMPSPDSLVEHLRSHWPQLPPATRRAIAALHGASSVTAAATAAVGGAGGAAATAGAAAEAPRVSWSAPSAAAAAAAPPSSSKSSGSSSAAVVEGVDLRSVVSYNAYGDEYEDLAAADLRRSSSSSSSSSSSAASAASGGAAADAAAVRSHVGLWPHFSRLNHSCAPNCVHYVVGDTMVVRAVQAIPEGTELTVSYLGRDDLAPAQVRQAALGGRYGFACGCSRCATERQLPEELQELLLQLHERARGDLAPRFESLLASTSTDPEDLLRAAGGGAEADDEDEGDEEAEEAQGRDGAAAAAGTGGVSPTAVAASTGGLTAAEAAKRALRKAQQQLQRAQDQWPTLLAALEPRLEEAARQLHLALRELQEDDEGVEEEPPQQQGAQGAQGAAAGGGGAGTGVLEPRPAMTRVQTAQAAAYQLLELLHLHAELMASATATGPGGAPSPARAAAASSALQACWHVLDAISRGSEVQVFQACKLLNDALMAARGRTGPAAGKPGPAAAASAAPEPVREAAALLGQSLLARYGRLRGRHLSAMTQAAMRVSKDFF